MVKDTREFRSCVTNLHFSLCYSISEMFEKKSENYWIPYHLWQHEAQFGEMGTNIPRVVLVISQDSI